MVILLVAINEYFINGYWWLFYYNLLFDIQSYIIIGYYWLFYVILP